MRVVATSQPLLPPKIAPCVFDAVSEALYSNRWLMLDYKNAIGKRNSVEVMPLGLVQQGTRLYVVCRFQGFENERNLALHRIQSAVMTTTVFDRPKGFDLKQYDDDGRFGFGEGVRVRLSFHIERSAGLHLLESPLSTDQEVVERDDGQLSLSATVVDSAMLERWILGFGNDISDVKRNLVTR